jgi:hypothetical protein
MPSIFRCHGQEWILPVLPRENILKIRPPLFISYFFAIESNKREPASSSNKHFLTEAYKTVLERTLGLHPGDVEMHRTLQRWKEDKYWTFAHGGAGDAYSTRAIHGVGTSTTDPNSRLKGYVDRSLGHTVQDISSTSHAIPLSGAHDALTHSCHVLYIYIYILLLFICTEPFNHLIISQALNPGTVVQLPASVVRVMLSNQSHLESITII